MKSVIGPAILGPTCLVGIPTGEVQFVSFIKTAGIIIGMNVHLGSIIH